MSTPPTGRRCSAPAFPVTPVAASHDANSSPFTFQDSHEGHPVIPGAMTPKNSFGSRSLEVSTNNDTLPPHPESSSTSSPADPLAALRSGHSSSTTGSQSSGTAGCGPARSSTASASSFVSTNSGQSRKEVALAPSVDSSESSAHNEKLAVPLKLSAFEVLVCAEQGLVVFTKKKGIEVFLLIFSAVLNLIVANVRFMLPATPATIVLYAESAMLNALLVVLVVVVFVAEGAQRINLISWLVSNLASASFFTLPTSMHRALTSNMSAGVAGRQVCCVYTSVVTVCSALMFVKFGQLGVFDTTEFGDDTRHDLFAGNLDTVMLAGFALNAVHATYTVPMFSRRAALYSATARHFCDRTATPDRSLAAVTALCPHTLVPQGYFFALHQRLCGLGRARTIVSEVVALCMLNEFELVRFLQSTQGQARFYRQCRERFSVEYQEGHVALIDQLVTMCDPCLDASERSRAGRTVSYV